MFEVEIVGILDGVLETDGFVDESIDGDSEMVGWWVVGVIGDEVGVSIGEFVGDLVCVKLIVGVELGTRLGAPVTHNV